MLVQLYCWYLTAQSALIAKAQHLWRWANWSDLFLCAILWAACVVALVDGGVTLTLALVLVAVAQTASIPMNARVNQRMASLLEHEPSGAPRMATVQCTEGRQHRFLYGPNGWEEAGPSTEVYPDSQSRQST